MSTTTKNNILSAFLSTSKLELNLAELFSVGASHIIVKTVSQVQFCIIKKSIANEINQPAETYQLECNIF